jgi:6-phosphogluconolactonase/glucosamine-6-phosphate isomerase/deaminase
MKRIIGRLGLEEQQRDIPDSFNIDLFLVGSGGNGHLPIVSVDNWPFR